MRMSLQEARAAIAAAGDERQAAIRTGDGEAERKATEKILDLLGDHLADLRAYFNQFTRWPDDNPR